MSDIDPNDDSAMSAVEIVPPEGNVVDGKKKGDDETDEDDEDEG